MVPHMDSQHTLLLARPGTNLRETSRCLESLAPTPRMGGQLMLQKGVDGLLDILAMGNDIRCIFV